MTPAATRVALRHLNSKWIDPWRALQDQAVQMGTSLRELEGQLGYLQRLKRQLPISEEVSGLEENLQQSRENLGRLLRVVQNAPGGHGPVSLQQGRRTYARVATGEWGPRRLLIDPAIEFFKVLGKAKALTSRMEKVEGSIPEDISDNVGQIKALLRLVKEHVEYIFDVGRFEEGETRAPRIQRVAFNKYNPTELLRQLIALLEREQLNEAAQAARRIAPIVSRAWSQREK